MFAYKKHWQTFAIRNQIVNILGFVGYMASVATTQFGCSSAKVATDNTKMKGSGCGPRKFYLQKEMMGASLVAQWLRICLPMQRTRVRALVWEDPTCHGATKPVHHNY